MLCNEAESVERCPLLLSSLVTGLVIPAVVRGDPRISVDLIELDESDRCIFVFVNESNLSISKSAGEPNFDLFAIFALLCSGTFACSSTSLLAYPGMPPLSCVGLLLSFVGLGLSCVGLDLSLVGLDLSFVGLALA